MSDMTIRLIGAAFLSGACGALYALADKPLKARSWARRGLARMQQLQEGEQ